MRKSLFYIFIILVTSNICCLQAQEEHEKAKPIPQITPPSPQSKIFEKYLDHSISESAGSPVINIPLYNISVDGLDIPIYLSYQGGGVKYNQYNGEVAVGWSLNIGGFRVSRTIHGMDDERYERYDENKFLNNPNNNYMHHPLSCFQIGGSSFNASAENLQEYTKLLDSRYDIFSYILPSTGGKFIIRDNKTGSISTIKKNNDLIEIPLKDEHILLDSLKITDDKGFQYFMGGNDIDKNFNSPANPNFHNKLIEASDYKKTAWPLKKIQTPTNQEIFFRYKMFVYSQDNYSNSQIIFKHAPIIYRDQEHTSSIIETDEWLKRVMHQQLFVSEITTPKEVIEFTRRDVENLESITIKSLDSNTVKKIHFLYTNTLTSRRLLNKVQILNKDDIVLETYEFDYYKPKQEINKAYPDHWGYYKFGTPKDKNVPGITIHEEFAEYNTVFEHIFEATVLGPRANMKPAKETFNNWRINQFTQDRINIESSEPPIDFSLKSITYPTGGKTEYEYENHQFKDTNGKTITGGGIRLKRITSYNSDSQNIITEFGYDVGQPNFDNYIVTSLHYTQLQAYFKPLESQDETNAAYYHEYFTTIFSEDPVVPELSGFQVSYPKITAKQYDTKKQQYNGKTVSRYSTPFTYKLGYYHQPERTNKKHVETHITPGPHYLVTEYNLGNEPHILERKVYNQQDSLIIHEKYNYDINRGYSVSDRTVNLKYTLDHYDLTTFGTTKSSMQDFHEEATYSVSLGVIPLLKSREVTEYRNDQVITQITTNEYNSRNQLAKTNKTTSIGDYTTSLTYPHEYNITPYPEMTSKNIIAPVIQTKTENNGQVVSVSRNNYYKDAAKTKNLILLKDIETAYKGSNTFVKEVSFDQYDEKGNILQYTGKDGIPVSYLWSYNYQYPIAEIRNSDFNSISNALGIDFLNSLSKTISPTDIELSKIDGLRSSLPHMQINTFSYKPLVGIVSAKNQAGIKTSYIYDIHNRLEMVLDDTGKAVESYAYNYRPYSVITSYLTDKNYNYFFNRPLNFEITTEGGSGSFTYKWYINNELQQSTTDSIFTYIPKDIGEYTLHCESVDNITKEIAVSYKKFDVEYAPLNLFNDALLTKYFITKKDYNIKLEGDGGSEQYTFNLSIKDDSGVIYENTNSNGLFTINIEKQGKIEIKSKVTDNVTGEVREHTMSKDCYSFVGQIIFDDYLLLTDESRLCKIEVSEGSGDYSYSWVVSRENYHKTFSSQSFDLSFPKAGSYTIACTVKDNIKNQERTFTYKATCNNQILNFITGEKTEEDVFVTQLANIVLKEATVVNLSLHFHEGVIEPGDEHVMSEVSVSVGGKSIIMKKTGTEDFSVPMQAGLNSITLQIRADGRRKQGTYASLVITGGDYLAIPGPSGPSMYVEFTKFDE